MEEHLQHELFDSYLFGTLTDDEKKAFEQRLENEPALKREFLLHKEIVSQIEDDAKDNFMRILQNIDSNHPVGQQRSLNPIVWKVAAAIAIFMALTVVVLTLRPSVNLFYDQYYAYYPLPEHTRMSRGGIVYEHIPSISEEDRVTIQSAYFAYGNKDFSAALSEFNKLSDSVYLIIPEVQFYQSLSYLAIDNAAQAIEGLETLRDEEFNTDQQVEWYMALAFLKKNNKKKALDILDQIGSESIYSEGAREIVKKLN